MNIHLTKCIVHNSQKTSNTYHQKLLYSKEINNAQKIKIKLNFKQVKMNIQPRHIQIAQNYHHSNVNYQVKRIKNKPSSKRTYPIN